MEINGKLRQLASRLQYDDGNLTIDPTGALRTITIYGIKYSVEFFRFFGEASIGKHFELIGRAGGNVTIAEIELSHEDRIAELEGIVLRKTALINELTAKLLEKKPQRDTSQNG